MPSTLPGGPTTEPVGTPVVASIWTAPTSVFEYTKPFGLFVRPQPALLGTSVATWPSPVGVVGSGTKRLNLTRSLPLNRQKSTHGFPTGSNATPPKKPLCVPARSCVKPGWRKVKDWPPPIMWCADAGSASSKAAAAALSSASSLRIGFPLIVRLPFSPIDRRCGRSQHRIFALSPRAVVPRGNFKSTAAAFTSGVCPRAFAGEADALDVPRGSWDRGSSHDGDPAQVEQCCGSARALGQASPGLGGVPGGPAPQLLRGDRRWDGDRARDAP